MSELGTIRERIQRAAEFFERREAVVLTTFNLGVPFLEDHALPTALGIDAATPTARRAQLHRELGVTPCTVFYDPCTGPRLSGRFRYEGRPVPMRGRFFHPKLVIIAGRDVQGVTWVYLGVGSGNLTLSGWGRNAEVFGETWIHTRRQQPWGVLDALLAWLQARAPLGEQRVGTDAVSLVRAALARMPSRNRMPDPSDQPWSGGLRADFYASVVHREGLPKFLRLGRARRPQMFWAYSPYWSDVAEGVAQFDARENAIVVARGVDGAFGLAREDAEALGDDIELLYNTDEDGVRFWHAKIYWIMHSTRVFTAVGSCNFTAAGLAGAKGNVEAMLVFEADSEEWLPGVDKLATDQLPDEVANEEDAPKPPPVAIVVAWDWLALVWRWWLKAGRKQREFVLHLPELEPQAIEAGTGSAPGVPPPRGSRFTIAYRSRRKAREWSGSIVELNLEHSQRTYGRPLSATEILEAWRGRTPAGGGVRGKRGKGDGEDETDLEDSESGEPAAFDLVNLYDLYRSMRALRETLRGLEARPDLQRAALIGRPDSVLALARLADRSVEAPVVRYLVLRELGGVLDTWGDRIGDAGLVEGARLMATNARRATRARLESELRDVRPPVDVDAVLAWFEQQLEALDGEAEQ